MPSQGWVQTLNTLQAQATFFNSYTTAKSVISGQVKPPLPAGFFETPGKAFRLDVLGAISNIVTTPGTITFQVMIGAVIGFTSGAIQLSTTAHTKLPFRFTAWLTARTVGDTTTATLIGQSEVAGQVFSISGADSTTSHAIVMGPNTSPAVGTGFDSTAAAAVDLWAGFSINNAGNGIQVEQFFLTSLN